MIRYDRRGFGLSEGTPGRAADAEDLGRLLDHLRLDAATLVGLSQGARVALAFALRQPERVSALVLDGPPDETGDAARPATRISRSRSTAAWSRSRASTRSAAPGAAIR